MWWVRRTSIDSSSLRNGIGAAALVAAALLGGVWYGLPQSAPTRAPVTTSGESGTVVRSVVTVHVSGQVVSPGLVLLPDDARVADAVAAAGGATRWAALDQLNLAQPIRDGERLVVPDARRLLEGADHGTPSGSSAVDLNAATAIELQTLTGVGPVLAERIVAYREASDGFDTVEDLLDVPGIGEAKLAAMRDDIIVR